MSYHRQNPKCKTCGAPTDGTDFCDQFCQQDHYPEFDEAEIAKQEMYD